ncbi:MAG: hypothetical protein ACOCQY_04375, partial [Halorhabdus sp.]
MSMSRDRIFGVDFSGSKEPGRMIWISEAKPKRNGLNFIDCSPAVERLQLQSRPDRDEVYQELRKLVKSHPSALFGFDFPFSLPEPIISNHSSWRDHLETTGQRYGRLSADGFQKDCIGRATSITGAVF